MKLIERLENELAELERINTEIEVNNSELAQSLRAVLAFHVSDLQHVMEKNVRISEALKQSKEQR